MRQLHGMEVHFSIGWCPVQEVPGMLTAGSRFINLGFPFKGPTGPTCDGPWRTPAELRYIPQAAE